MYGGFINASGTQAGGVIRFWWTILWVNIANAAIVFLLVAAAALSWRIFS